MEEKVKIFADEADDAQELLKEFKENGFFVLKGLLSQDEVEKVKQQLSELTKNVIIHSSLGKRTEINNRRLWPDKMPNDLKPLVDVDPVLLNSKSPDVELKVRRYFRMAVHDKYFAELARHPRLLSICRTLLGNDVKLLQSMALCKPPGSGEKRWHQDNAYFRLQPNDVLAFWIALDSASVENGCMHVVPRSHLHGIVPHGIPQDKEVYIPKGQEHAFYSLLQKPQPEHVVAVVMEPGDALVFHGELEHYTPPNGTNVRRRAIQYHYASSSCAPTKSDHSDPNCLEPQYWSYRKGELLVSGNDFGGEHI